MANQRKKVRILSIDGGGIRGVIPGVILSILEQNIQQICGNKNARLADYFDLMAGTSTGGILSACYLLPQNKESKKAKFSAAEIVDLYFQHGEEIFDRPFFHKIRSAGGILDEKYPAKGLKKTLKKYMGDTWMSDLIKPSLITAYDIERRKAHFFTQQDAKQKGKNFLVRDAVWSTAAAPTYFECTNIKDDLKRDYALIDGGVYANNPTLCAYAEARSLFKKPDTQKAVTAADMLILSVGTGNDKKTYPYQKAKNWGQAEWVKPIIDIMMSGVAETVDYQVRQIYDAIEHSSNYLRVDAPLPNTVNHDMDDASQENMHALKKQGELVAQKFKKQLEDFAKTIVETDGCERIY